MAATGARQKGTAYFRDRTLVRCNVCPVVTVGAAHVRSNLPLQVVTRVAHRVVDKADMFAVGL